MVLRAFLGLGIHGAGRIRGKESKEPEAQNPKSFDDATMVRAVPTLLTPPCPQASAC